MRLIFSPEAEQDVEKTDAWWRENRRDAPRLFAEELAGVCAEIQRKPLIKKPYCERRGLVIRRWLRTSLVYMAAVELMDAPSRAGRRMISRQLLHEMFDLSVTDPGRAIAETPTTVVGSKLERDTMFGAGAIELALTGTDCVPR